MEELDEHNYLFKDIIEEIVITLKYLYPCEDRDKCLVLTEFIKIKLLNITALDLDSLKNTEAILNTVYSILRREIKNKNENDERSFSFRECTQLLNDVLYVISSSSSYHGISNKSTSSIFNSKKFYEEKIEQANKEKEELSNKIDAIKKELESTTNESEKTKKELEEKEKELCMSIDLLSTYKKEMLQNEKINDAKREWKGKIIEAFDNLKKYIKPIKDEHRRLGFLFWGYLGISVVIVLCLFIIEYIICCKIEAVEGFPTWETYLSLILPIPIAMGGLWGFVTLMHRVQRQLVILAKQIHEIEYVEGLLLTTNTLSTNINESMSKVNLAIEKLLENHLNYDGSTLTEELLLEKEEKKDAMPYEEVLKLVEKVAGMVSKNKE